MFFLAAVFTITLASPEVAWMVLLFFPAMAVNTPVLQVAAITVGFSLLLRGPELTLLLRRVFIQVRLAPEVLPVVSILTLVTHVTTHLVVKRAPDSFEMEHIKVSILLHLVQQINRKFVLTVSEGAQISKVTVFHTVRVAIAELGLVLFRVIERLDAVVSSHACVTIRTFACLCILTHL